MTYNIRFKIVPPVLKGDPPVNPAHPEYPPGAILGVDALLSLAVLLLEIGKLGLEALLSTKRLVPALLTLLKLVPLWEVWDE